MATATAIAIRRDAALERLTQAITTLKGDAVEPFKPPKQPEMREAALIEWAVAQLTEATGDAAPVEVQPNQMPKWYIAMRDKAHADGATVPPLLEGETQKTYLERTGGATIDTAVTEDGESVTVTEDAD